jgi:hypothetical protein
MIIQFGVEIEVVLRPQNTESHRTDVSGSVWRGKFAEALKRRGLKAFARPVNETRKNFPEHYNKWFITKDASLHPPPDASM